MGLKETKSAGLFIPNLWKVDSSPESCLQPESGRGAILSDARMRGALPGLLVAASTRLRAVAEALKRSCTLRYITASTQKTRTRGGACERVWVGVWMGMMVGGKLGGGDDSGLSGVGVLFVACRCAVDDIGCRNGGYRMISGAVMVLIVVWMTSGAEMVVIGWQWYGWRGGLQGLEHLRDEEEGGRSERRRHVERELCVGARPQKNKNVRCCMGERCSVGEDDVKWCA